MNSIRASIAVLMLGLAAAAHAQQCGPAGCGVPSTYGWQAAGVGPFGRATICPPGGGQMIVRGGLGGAACQSGACPIPRPTSGPVVVNPRPTVQSLDWSQWPCVVRIDADKGGNRQSVVSGVVIFCEDGGRGLVLTCAHGMPGVVGLTIRFADGRTEPGELVVADGSLDVALVSFRGFAGCGFKRLLDASPPAGQDVSYCGNTPVLGQGGIVQGQRFTGSRGRVIGVRGVQLLVDFAVDPPEGTSGGPIYTAQGIASIVAAVEPGAATEGPSTERIRQLICKHAAWALPGCCDDATPPLPDSPPVVEPPVVDQPEPDTDRYGELVPIVRKNSQAIAEIRGELVQIKRIVREKPLMLQGEKGEKGDRGEKGDKGPPGTSADVNVIVSAVLKRLKEEQPTPEPGTTSAPVYWDIVPKRK